MIEIDGSMGEGGGQILRTAVALSAVTGKGFRAHSLRRGRPNPGLARQHLASVEAVARVCGAEVEGAGLGATELTFRPARIRPGKYRISTGGAGSATLVLQAVLPPLALAPGPSEINLEGGTHNPYAPPFEFLEWTLAPLLRRVGIRLDLQLHRPGFHPVGGGRMTARIEGGSLEPLTLEHRGPILRRRARAIVSALPSHIAQRELDTVATGLGIQEDDLEFVQVPDPAGPGNAVLVRVDGAEVGEVFTGFGRRNVPAERVAGEVVEAVREWEAGDVPVGRHLADQLLVPLALAGGGSFRTLEPSSHARTNARVMARFLDAEARFEPLEGAAWRVEVEAGPGVAPRCGRWYG